MRHAVAQTTMMFTLTTLIPLTIILAATPANSFFVPSSRTSIVPTTSVLSWCHQCSHNFITNRVTERVTPLTILYESASGNGKKKRRRRKDSSPAIEDDLPEFDLTESTGNDSGAPKTTKSDSSPGMGSFSMDTNDATLAEAMRGSGRGSTMSGDVVTASKELLQSRDRSLEGTFEFDDVKAPLPKLGRQSSGSAEIGGVGKKKAKSDARRAAAIAAAEEAEKENSVFLGFLGGGDGIQDDLKPIKLIENATWIGIFVLVAWELYINSPLFDRAQPLIPVVYEFLL